MDNLILGFSTAFDVYNLLWCFFGVLLGTLVGVLPGLGPTTTIAILLPLSYHIGEPISTIIFLAGIFYGSQYGGSITCILLKIPGEASSTVTILDGYPMSQKGRAGAAITITAMASFLAGTVAAIIIALLSKPLLKITFLFGPWEYAGLMLLGILACIMVTQGNLWKGILMTMLGGFLGLIGTDVLTGKYRFTAGSIYLIDGISFITLTVGIFAISEALFNLMTLSIENKIIKIKSLYPTKEEIKESIMPAIRGTFLGSLLGLLPGGTAVLSSFLSYALEKRLSNKPNEFGKGAIAGIAGPEAANNAAAQTNFLPTLMLGIPITPIMSLIISILMIQGIQPGPNVINNNPTLFWGLIASMWIGNIFCLALNIPLIKLWVLVLRIPKLLLHISVIGVSIIGVYSINHSWVDIFLILIFGIIGLLARYKNFSLAPLVLAFVVVPMFEEYFNRALLISNNNLMTFIERPISLFLLLLTFSLIIINLFFKKTKLAS
jgi:putative tricarboxylic transport membrane protein